MPLEYAMQKKHKIISLTSIILTATTNLIHAESLKTYDMNFNSYYNNTHIALIGQHGEGGESSEGGESGEGGFNAENLKTDDIAFGTALEVIHAHYLIGEKLYASGDYDAAESFFGHPISEVLLELQSAFEARNIVSPEEEMYLLLEIAQQNDKLTELQQAIQKVVKKIDIAFEQIKLADKKMQINNMALINAELIRRSKLEYFQAIENDDLGALQDAIGYFDVAYLFFKRHQSEYESVNSDKTQEFLAYFQKIEPFFANFKAIDEKTNHKKLAGITAKLEIGLANLN